jgi:hypothetical protein
MASRPGNSSGHPQFRQPGDSHTPNMASSEAMWSLPSTLLHARLAEPWTLNSLAQEVQLSGSQLVRAFDLQIDQVCVCLRQLRCAPAAAQIGGYARAPRTPGARLAGRRRQVGLHEYAHRADSAMSASAATGAVIMTVDAHCLTSSTASALSAVSVALSGEVANRLSNPLGSGASWQDGQVNRREREEQAGRHGKRRALPRGNAHTGADLAARMSLRSARAGHHRRDADMGGAFRPAPDLPGAPGGMECRWRAVRPAQLPAGPRARPRRATGTAPGRSGPAPAP